MQANRNCIAIASSHDIQELDVSGILATQIYTWLDDDLEAEAKGYYVLTFTIWLYLLLLYVAIICSYFQDSPF